MRVVITFETGKYSFRAFSYKASGGLVSYTHAAIYPVVKNDVSVGLRHAWTLHNTCVSDSIMKSILLRWAPSLNDRSKLKGQCTDVKSGCGTSVGPSLNPHSLSLTKCSCYCPFKVIFRDVSGACDNVNSANYQQFYASFFQLLNASYYLLNASRQLLNAS